jgi:CheY-like chemotaxis protein
MSLGIQVAPERRARAGPWRAEGGALQMTRKKILLVDDSGTILMMEKMILAREPYDLVTAKDGKEAIEKAATERPDLILLDVVMPHLTGFEVLEELRAHESTKATPVILVTTRGEAANVEAGYAGGCNDYVTKPINSVELITKVRNYLTD